MRFVGQAYLNRRYTRLAPSIVLAAGIGLLTVLAAIPTLDWRTPALGWIATFVFVGLQTALYPFAREGYYRFTAPIRQSLPILLIPLLFLAIVYAGKLFVFLFLVTFTIPLGTIGFIYLATTEHRGRGWRLQ